MHHPAFGIASSATVLALVATLVAALASPPAAASADRTFSLFASAAQGWGSTPTNLGNPGPTITVDKGDNVILLLNGTDGQQHRWFIDYNNDQNDGANEPNSPSFRSTEITWNFTASQNGTFNYRDRNNPTMAGSIVIQVPVPGLFGISSTVVIVIGVGVAFIAALMAVGWYQQRRKGPKQEPKD